MHVHIPEEFLPFIQKNVDAGSFASADALVADALRFFKDQEEFFALDKEMLNQSIDKSIRDLDAGLGISLAELKNKLNLP